MADTAWRCKAHDCKGGCATSALVITFTSSLLLGLLEQLRPLPPSAPHLQLSTFSSSLSLT